MKRAFAFTVLMAALLLPVAASTLSEHIEYNISVSSDGSALWRIIHVTDANSSLVSWEEFEEKLYSVVNSAKDDATRDMALDLASLEMKTEIDWETSSRTTKYVFRWQNFSITKEHQIVFGDVFGDGFFANFYGDGELYITYPQECTLSLASPLPNEQDNASRMLHWYRTQDFAANPSIEFTLRDSVSSQEGNLVTTIAVLSFAGLCAVGVGFLVFNHKRKQKEELASKSASDLWQKVPDSKEEILKLLKSSGGSMRQSEICNRLRYSRAKTSILLAEMERGNQIRRDKRGKNKIVYLVK